MPHHAIRRLFDDDEAPDSVWFVLDRDGGIIDGGPDMQQALGQKLFDIFPEHRATCGDKHELAWKTGRAAWIDPDLDLACTAIRDGDTLRISTLATKARPIPRGREVLKLLSFVQLAVGQLHSAVAAPPESPQAAQGSLRLVHSAPHHHEEASEDRSRGRRRAG